MARVRSLLLVALCGPLAAWAEEPAPSAAEGPPPAEVKAQRLDDGRSQYGGVGLSRVRSASILPRSIAVSAHGGTFQQGALTASAGVDQHRLMLVGAAVAPTSWLELAITSRSSTHDQSFSTPSRLVRLNEVFLYGKGGTEVSGGALALALEGSLRIPPPMGTWGQVVGVSPQVGGLVTYSMQPFRFHLNAGFTADNTKALAAPGTNTDPTREYALGITKYNQVSLGLGAEGRWSFGGAQLTPFVEWTMDAPLGSGSMPSRLTPGVRVRPWRGFILDAAVELGLTRGTPAGVPAVPAYMAMVALGYQAFFDPERELVERTIERTIEKEKLVERAPSKGTVRGVVHDAATGKPISDAIVTLPGKPRVLAGEDGKFEIPEVEPGPLKVKAERKDYASGEVGGTVAAGKEIHLELALKALPPPPPAPATLKGTVVSETDKPLTAAEVSVPSAGLAPKSFAGGEYQLDTSSGEITIEASAAGHLKQGRRLVARPGETVVADFVLKAVPKKTLVVLRKDKIEIKKQVHFATNKDVILPDSGQLLDQVAATILENVQLELIRIEGHTDSQGDDAYNQDLSERRARSVERALLERGVSISRLSAVGFGESKPIANNKTVPGRALNRRVEFMIEK